LNGHDTPSGANAKLRDVKPIGDDGPARARVDLNVIVHASKIRGVMRVDKRTDCL
jgi:hypothetical protein